MENPGVKWGLIGAGAIILVALIAYVYDAKFYLSYNGFAIFLISIFFLYKTATEERKLRNGYASFSELLRSVFLAGVIMTVCYQVFNMIMVFLIDPGLADMSKEVALEAMQKMESILGEEGYEKAIEDIQAQSFKPSIGEFFLGLASSIIFTLIPAALISVIMKKEKPLTIDTMKHTPTDSEV